MDRFCVELAACRGMRNAVAKSGYTLIQFSGPATACRTLQRCEVAKSGTISIWQLASAESESRASGKQKPKVTPKTPGLLNRKFEHRLERSS